MVNVRRFQMWVTQNVPSSPTETAPNRGERREEQSGIHKTIILDRYDMPYRAYCFTVLYHSVSEGVHFADDYIIYR